MHSNDDKIVNLAIDSNCEFIVTENIRHFEDVKLKKIRTKSGKEIKVYRPEDFYPLLQLAMKYKK